MRSIIEIIDCLKFDQNITICSFNEKKNLKLE
jgi:hypothetical protein